MEYINYSAIEPTWPKIGRHIIAYQEDDQIVVYQAYKPEIADYAVKHQHLGGPDFSVTRMSWIKPNFLWMMYRSGWANKKNQERILAMYMNVKDFNKLIEMGVLSHYDVDLHGDRQQWSDRIKQSEVVIQWDPDHKPNGDKHKTRRAIQIGLRGDTLKNFCDKWITKIEDITDFVIAQRNQVDPLIPYEKIYLQ